MLKLQKFLNKKILVGLKSEDYELKYASAIQEVGENHIGIAIPYHQLRPIMLHTHEQVQYEYRHSSVC